MSKPKRKLLLLACSNRKRRDKGLLPAIERYDGVNYRVIKKLMREGRFPKNVDVMILSAKYGLLDAATPIAYYDRRMDKLRARELHSEATKQLRRATRGKRYDGLFINLGKVYLESIAGWDAGVEGELDIQYARGGIGQKMAATKAWLEQEARSK